MGCFASANAAPGSTIVFQSGLAGKVALSSSLTISASMHIQGSTRAFVIDGGNQVQDLIITAGTVVIDNLTFSGGYTLDGQGAGISAPSTSVTLTLNGTALLNNTVSEFGDGGAIYINGSLTMSGADVEGNSGQLGGGVTANDATISNSVFKHNGYGTISTAGTLTLTNSLIDSTTDGFGAVVGRVMHISYTTFSNNHGQVGAIRAAGATTIDHCTFTGNVGGLYSSGGFYVNNAVPVTISNSTFSGDSGNYFSEIMAVGGATVSIENSTITGGAAGNAVMGVNTGSLTVRNSVITGGPAACGALSAAARFISAGHNLVGDSSCGFTQPGDMQGADPALGPLQDNGGPTLTREPSPATCSPLTNNGDPSDAGPTDQRGTGFPRTAATTDGGAVQDIGAVQTSGSRLPCITSQPQGEVLFTGQTLSLHVGTFCETLLPASTFLSFQWVQGAAALSGNGANTPRYSKPAAPTDSGNYSATVTNPFGTTTSDSIVVTVQDVPALPTPITLLPGDNLVLQAPALAGVSYQWQFETAAAFAPLTGNGANTAKYEVDQATAAATGVYRLQLTNACGSVFTNEVTVQLAVPPAIDAQPSNVELFVSQAFTLTATELANSLMPGWQWR